MSGEGDSAPEQAAPQRQSRLRRPLLLLAPVVLIVGGVWVYLSGGRYESTDNASVQAGLVGVAADVSGRVTEVDVTENQQVSAGQVLFRLDNAAATANVEAAEAALGAARAGAVAQQADYTQSRSGIAAAQATLSYARGEAARQKSLVAQGISSQAQYDQAVTAARTASDALAAAEAEAQSKSAKLGGQTRGAVDGLPAVRQAAAALDAARIALGNTVVRASKAGVVTKVSQLQPGSYVTAARPVFMLAGTHFWIESNFKENQLEFMRVGQPATITIDAYPDAKIKGHVASFSPGTGNSFSVLPAENATGNWVKVVQRLPVEIAIDEAPAGAASKGMALHAGLSSNVEVDTGHKRHLFGADSAPPAQ